MEGGPGAADIRGRGDGDVVRPGVFGHGFAGLRVRHGDTNGPQEVLLVCGAPVHVRVVSEAGGDVLHPVVGTLGAGSRFCACYEGGRSPAAEATAMAELVIDEVEECGVVAVLDDLSAPG